jgi:hypothetical protein
MRLVLDARTASFGALIDYAGVFPPSSLAMGDAITAYRDHRSSADRWVVGRFLTRASQLEALAQAATATFDRRTGPWPVGVIFDMGPGVATSLCLDFAAEMGNAITIDAVEAKAQRPDPDAIAQLIEATGALDAETAVFVELVSGHPPAPQIDAVAENLRALGRNGGVKLRCGGAGPADFPSVEEVAEFVWDSTNEGVPFKATAGLHQPIRHFDTDLGAWRHGFVNILIASIAATDGEPRDVVESIIAETDPSQFSVTATAVQWKHVFAAGSAIRRSRRNGFVAFGSCDLDEPIEALRSLDMLGEGA